MTHSNTRSELLTLYNMRKLDSGQIWLLFILLGWSYGSMDQMGKQILFYLTLGGFGLWGLYRLVTLSGKIKEYNRKVALEIGLDSNDFLSLGLI